MEQTVEEESISNPTGGIALAYQVDAGRLSENAARRVLRSNPEEEEQFNSMLTALKSARYAFRMAYINEILTNNKNALKEFKELKNAANACYAIINQKEQNTDRLNKMNYKIAARRERFTPKYIAKRAGIQAEREILRSLRQTAIQTVQRIKNDMAITRKSIDYFTTKYKFIRCVWAVQVIGDILTEFSKALMY